MTDVSIDPEELHGVIQDLRRTQRRIREYVEPLRTRLVDQNVSTYHLDRLAGAADDIDLIVPDLSRREQQARDIQRDKPGVGAVSLPHDIRTPQQERAYGPVDFTTKKQPSGSTKVSFTPTSAPGDDGEEEDEEPSLMSVDGVKKLGGDIVDWGKDKVDDLKEILTEAWNSATAALADMWHDMADWWDEQTAKLGGWIDENLEGVRNWIRDHAGILRVIAIIFKVVGWVLVAIGAILFVVGLILDATGIGAIAGLPTGAAALAIMGVGFTLVGVGDTIDLLVDWGERKIDGQQLVQGLAVEVGLTLLTFVGIGAVGRILKQAFKHMPPSWARKIEDWIERNFRRQDPNGGRPRGSGGGLTPDELARLQRLNSTPVDELSDADAAWLRQTRNRITVPEGTPMQRALSPQDVEKMLDGTYGPTMTRGFTARQEDVDHLRTPQDIYDSLGLDYQGTQHGTLNNGRPNQGGTANDEAFVLRYDQQNADELEVPRDSRVGGDGGRDGDARDPDNPFTGNGWTKGDDPIPEFHTGSGGGQLDEGAQIWRFDSEGNRELYAELVFEDGEYRWIRR